MTAEGSPPESPSAGTCYGYEVRSDLSFRYLRSGSGIPLEVKVANGAPIEPTGEPIWEWMQHPEHHVFASLYPSAGGYAAWVDQVGWFEVNPSIPSISVPKSADPVRRETSLWSIPTALCFIERGDLALHASSVEVDGQALLFAAPGFAGKTTLASAFLQAGYRPLSEDLSCCRLSDPPTLFPGPAMLRVRRDVYERLELPGAHVVAEFPDRVHLAIDDDLRGTGAPIPIRAVVFLRQDSRQRMESVAPVDCIADLWTLTFKESTESDHVRSFESIVTLSSAVPMWNLYRTLDFANLRNVVDEIVATCL